MKVLSIIAYTLLYLLASFLVLMSMDTLFDAELTIFQRIGGTIIHASPGLVIFLLTYFLRNKPLYLGVLVLCIGVFFAYLFSLFDNLKESILTILTVEVPIIFSGTVLIIKSKKT
jgi:hypothetical protein